MVPFSSNASCNKDFIFGPARNFFWSFLICDGFTQTCNIFEIIISGLMYIWLRVRAKKNYYMQRKIFIYLNGWFILDITKLHLEGRCMHRPTALGIVWIAPPNFFFLVKWLWHIVASNRAVQFTKLDRAVHCLNCTAQIFFSWKMTLTYSSIK